MFDPVLYDQAHGQGTGLGLDMARRIVHLRRNIEFRAARTQVFRVSLPVAGTRSGLPAPDASQSGTSLRHPPAGVLPSIDLRKYGSQSTPTPEEDASFERDDPISVK